MADRKEIKAKAKVAFKANYWKCVLVAFIGSLFTGAAVSSSANSATDTANSATGTQDVAELTEYFNQNPEALALVISVVIGALLFIMLVSTVVKCFINNPIKMGCDSFYLKNSDDPNTGVGEIKTGFKPSYGRNIWALFLKDLLVSLGCLLFIVPGVIIALQYQLVPFILAEDPDIKAGDALRKSKEMMKGHKWEAFMLDLSFFGWYFLGALTAGILYVFYVNPYVNAADAEFYKAVKASTAAE